MWVFNLSKHIDALYADMKMILLDGFNLRLGLDQNNRDMKVVMAKIVEKNDSNFSLEEVIAMPEIDTWE